MIEDSFSQNVSRENWHPRNGIHSVGTVTETARKGRRLEGRSPAGGPR